MNDKKRWQYMGKTTRGKVWAFQLTDDPTDELLIFWTPKGSVRGGDYHDHRQYNIVVRGRVKFFERFGPDMKVQGKGKVSGEKVTYLKEGQMAVFEPGIPHWFVALTDCIMIEFFEKPRSKYVDKEYRDIVMAVDKFMKKKEKEF